MIYLGRPEPPLNTDGVAVLTMITPHGRIHSEVSYSDLAFWHGFFFIASASSRGSCPPQEDRLRHSHLTRYYYFLFERDRRPTCVPVCDWLVSVNVMVANREGAPCDDGGQRNML
jgi:hypothetical protein